MRLITFLFIFFLTAGACTTKSDEHRLLSARDATMQKYFHIVDSLPVRDTLNEEFMLLRAYHRNDTAFLNNEYQQLTTYLKHLPPGQISKSCEKNLVKLQDYDEAYRFSYGVAFCTIGIDITIGQKANAYTINVKIVSVNITTGDCHVSRQFAKPIKQWEWEKLKKDIYYFDFWGMQEQNDVGGLDGSSVSVYGYKTILLNHFKLKKVERWSPEKTALGELLRTAFNLSEVKGTCLNISVIGE